MRDKMNKLINIWTKIKGLIFKPRNNILALADEWAKELAQDRQGRIGTPTDKTNGQKNSDHLDEYWIEDYILECGMEDYYNNKYGG